MAVYVRGYPLRGELIEIKGDTAQVRFYNGVVWRGPAHKVVFGYA